MGNLEGMPNISSRNESEEEKVSPKKKMRTFLAAIALLGITVGDNIAQADDLVQAPTATSQNESEKEYTLEEDMKLLDSVENTLKQLRVFSAKQSEELKQNEEAGREMLEEASSYLKNKPAQKGVVGQGIDTMKEKLAVNKEINDVMERILSNGVQSGDLERIQGLTKQRDEINFSK